MNDKDMKKVIILRGLPGSGKSRYAKRLKEESKLISVICSTDEYFMVDDLDSIDHNGVIRNRIYKFDPTKLVEYH